MAKMTTNENEAHKNPFQEFEDRIKELTEHYETEVENFNNIYKRDKFSPLLTIKLHHIETMLIEINVMTYSLYHAKIQYNYKKNKVD